MRVYSDQTHCISLYEGNVIDFYDSWPTPTVIVCDGPYGVHGFPGDLPTDEGLDAWYEPHIRKWSEKATPQTTLWFWGIEIGWATVHPVLRNYGWEYVCCNVWNKGMGHVAGNSNTKSLRQLPVVTEICVQYVKQPEFYVNKQKMSMMEWLRYEWQRTGLPFSKTNEACEVLNAATRKYFTTDWLWYAPPPDAFERLVAYANRHGRPEGQPYFTIDGNRSLTREEWVKYRAKFYCPLGVTNVWSQPPVNGTERLKLNGKALHLNQKPINLMELTIGISSAQGDVVWEPFGGLCSAAVAAHNLKRSCVSAETDHKIYQAAVRRLQNHVCVQTLGI